MSNLTGYFKLSLAGGTPPKARRGRCPHRPLLVQQFEIHTT